MYALTSLVEQCMSVGDAIGEARVSVMLEKMFSLNVVVLKSTQSSLCLLDLI